MKKGKLIGKIFGITLAILMAGAMFGATALPLGDLDKNQVSGQEDTSYITVHALDLEGIEIVSIEGEELFVSALVEGVNFTAASTGIYRFTIIGGAAEACPPEAQPDHPEWWGWNTRILIYKNRQICWSGGPWAPEHPNPANWDFLVGSSDLQSTYEAAEAAGKGMSVDIALAENEYVILVVNDSKGYFWDNSGGVSLSITILPPVPQYKLAIYSSAGGSVATPGEGTFTYDEGTVVDLVAEAEAEEGYHFVNWTGNIGTVANVTAAITTVTMSSNYSITANFETILPPVYPMVTTQAAGVAGHTAGLYMTYTMGNFSSVQLRFAYKRYDGSGWSYTDWVSRGAAGSYGVTLTGLSGGAQFDFKAQLTYDNTVIEGNTLQFTTGHGAVCFIATAAYGTPMAEEVQILREFRDKYLLTNPLGQAFVDFYYKVSPPIAEFITEHPILKPIVRAGLVPAVAMSTVIVNTTTAEKMALLGLLVLVSVAVVVRVIRRQGRGTKYTRG